METSLPSFPFLPLPSFLSLLEAYSAMRSVVCGVKMLFIIGFFILRVSERFTSFGGGPHDCITACRANVTFAGCVPAAFLSLTLSAFLSRA